MKIITKFLLLLKDGSYDEIWKCDDNGRAFFKSSRNNIEFKNLFDSLIFYDFESPIGLEEWIEVPD